MYSLTWTCKFPNDNDTYYFAHCYPYTYSDLIVSRDLELRKKFVSAFVLGLSEWHTERCAEEPVLQAESAVPIVSGQLRVYADSHQSADVVDSARAADEEGCGGHRTRASGRDELVVDDERLAGLLAGRFSRCEGTNTARLSWIRQDASP